MYYETGDLAAALEVFPNCVTRFRELAEAAEASGDPRDQDFAQIRGASAVTSATLRRCSLT